MSHTRGSAFDLVEKISRKAPEYLDLFTAGNDADFEKAFTALLEKAISDLEKNKKLFQTLDEEGLSAALSMSLSMPGFLVTRETHSNGHVDLTIVVNYCVPMRTKLGEAKIYDGPKYHLKGLEQLLGRYTTGREGRGLMIVYFRKRNIANLVQKLRKKMDAEHSLHQQGPTADHLLKWSFISIHAHSCGENLEVGHIGCNLFIE